MRLSHPRTIRFVLPLFLLFGISSFSQAPVTNRITQPVNDQQMSSLRGNIHPKLQRAVDQGRLAASAPLGQLALIFKRSDAQQKALDLLLDQQQDPASPNYHKWLTPEQFGQRFGLGDADLAKVTGWLQAHGFRDIQVARGRDYVTFDGTAGQVDAAFRTQMHQYVLDGKTHYANATEPYIPAAFASVVAGIRSLNDFRPKPRVRVQPKFTSSKTGDHFVAPADFATIYNVTGLYNSGITGTGQKIAVMGQTDFNSSDISAFRTAAALPAKSPTKTLIPGSSNPGIVSGDEVEADLDIEWSGAVAKDAQILYIFSTNVFNSMQYAVDNNLAPVISISYGDCEPNFTSSEMSTVVGIAQKANAQGQTIVGPSGDDAAADCDYPATSSSPPVTSATHGLQVDVPASLPYVTGVGGTAFNENGGNYWAPATSNTAGGGSALSYIPEMGWNDTAYELLNGGGLTGTGGGASTRFGKPTWQTGTGVPNDGARDVPDISFNASVTHDGYLICSGGSCPNPTAADGEGFRASDGSLFVVGGTSAGAPVFAAIVALINQKTGSTQGNLNPKLYSLAASTPAAFHDVTSGDNKVPCTTGTTDCPSGTTMIGYTAGPGYDQVTGLGSVDASALAVAWGGSAPPVADFQMSSDATSLTILHGTSKTANITISPGTGFTGTVNLTCSVASSLLTTTCSVSPISINTSGTAVVTINASSTLASAGHSRPFAPRGWLYESGFALFGIVWTARNRRRLLLMIGTLVLAVGALAWLGCGGGGGSSTPVLPTLTGTVTVHAVSGSLAHDTPITVTVN